MKNVIEFGLKTLALTVSAATLFGCGAIVGIVSYILADDDTFGNERTKYNNNTQLKS